MKTIHTNPTLNAVIPEHLRKLKITKKLLRDKGACEVGIKWFSKQFPKGCAYPRLRQKIAECGIVDYEEWCLFNIGGDEASAGDGGAALAGDGGTASVGDRGTALVGDGGTASAGCGGVITILFWSGVKYIRKCAEVGDDGLKPNVKYKLDEKGKFVEA